MVLAAAAPSNRRCGDVWVNGWKRSMEATQATRGSVPPRDCYDVRWWVRAAILLAHIGVAAGGGAQTQAGPGGVGPGARRPSGDRERSAALAAYDAGDAAAAKVRLQGISGRYPTDFAVQEALGLIEAEAGDAAGALPHLRAAANAQPRDAEAEANLGAAYLALKQAPEAVKTLDKAVALGGRNASVAAGVEANLGRALFLNKQYGRAAEVLGEASRLDAGNIDLVFDRAVAFDAGGQSGRAMEALTALPAEKRTAAVESLWGDVAEHAGRYEESVTHMQAAARMEPSEPHLFALVVELLRHWTWQAADEIAQFGMARYPESKRLRLADGIALYGNTKYAEAATVFAELLRGEPDSNVYGDLLGRSCSALGEGETADCTSLTAFAEGHPANAPAAIFAAISILHRPQTEGNLDQAERLLRQAIVHEPRSAEARYQMGVLEQERRQWPESEVSLLEAVRLRPGYAEAHYRLSRAYSHEGKAELARHEVELQQRYALEEKASSDARLKEVTIFLTDAH